MRLHGTPISITFDRYARFTGRVWKEFQGMGTIVEL